MPSETTIVREHAFKTIRSAVDQMVDLIKPTFGPASNKVIIDKFTHHLVVDDGVQIARDFELQDPAENAVVKIVREAAIRANDREGDGTTGALIMLQAIIREVSKKSRFDGRKIVEELRQGLKDVKSHLLKSAKKIHSKDDLKKVALVSFADEPTAEIISELYFKLGKDAVITVEKSPTMETIVEISSGIKIESGYITPYMVNNPERMECVIEKPYILLTDYKITENSEIFPLIEKMAADNKRGLVIIADNIEGNAVATLIINLPNVINPETKKLGSFPSCAIISPSGENRSVFLEDLAVLTGAKVFSSVKGDKIENAEIGDLGRAEKFIAKRDESIIIGGKGKKSDIDTNASMVRLAIDNEKDERIKTNLKMRLGRFTNKIATIRVGAPTENEQKALKYKTEDAINSVRSAFRNGVVCGAGRALAYIRTPSLILDEALQYPMRQLEENMNLSDIVTKGYAPDIVHNAITGKTGKFMDVGVMDSVDVVIAGVESAVSIASLLLTSCGIIVEHQKNEDHH